MRAGRRLRQLVIARIEDQVAELAGKVFDQALASTAHPYVTLGPSYWNDTSVTCVKARTMTLQIDLWHSQESKGACEDLTDDIAAAIQGWSDTDALTMHPANVTLVRVMDDPSGDVHGIIQMEVLIEQDPA
ncbi:hypothetical protein TW83_07675 [Paracoccus sp. S4493]|uniref:DUF3168 domain-containing protein n=1 Tax=Paracoccus sp. S4493 TaxID=579490 RepID=UPI0005FA7AFF|nr:DUF3168 domain-containing protein [Paracoccus sp. S4493]KJZ31634.1 hypothetical protein TW83_07675 [Paracoccus sp. S4493]